MVLTIYIVLAVFISAITLLSWFQNRGRPLIKTYLPLCLCTLGWLLSLIAFFHAPTYNTKVYIDNVPFVFIAICPVLLLLFVVQFYGGFTLRKQYILLLSIIPAITGIIVLIPSLTWMLRVNYQLLQASPLYKISFSWNFWFYIHAAYSYALMLFSSIFVFKQHQKQNKSYALSSKLMITGIAVTMFCNIATLLSPHPFCDYTLVGSGCSLVIYYLAIANNPTSEYLTLARKTFYSYIDLPVLILDKESNVLDLNHSARALLKSIHYIYTPPFSFNGIMLALKSAGAVIEKDDTTNSTNIFIRIDGHNAAYRLTQRAVTDTNGQEMGSYVVLLDITQMSRIIEDLSYISAVDPLTGIPNRRAFEQKCKELDTPKHLPISFIVGDVNRLKYVNDNLGHQQGDQLLKTIAKALVRSCPPEGLPARIGGDEFVMVIPRCNSEAAHTLIQKIDNIVKADASAFPNTSIALGVVTKTNPEQMIAELLSRADREMYKQKQHHHQDSDCSAAFE